MDATAAVRVEGLVKRFPGPPLGLGSREVLHGIGLEVPAGGALGVVGPNGSGKSTLLRVLAGVERPTRGRVSVLGGSPEEVGVRRRIGFLPETSPFPEELTARTALELVAALSGVPRAERRERAKAMLERAGLAADAGRRLGRFSKGMLRRFGLAQAFLHEPSLVLLDEPSSGLDAGGVQLLGELLAEARARGAALVMSSHVLAEVMRHTDELCVLVDGRVAAAGEPSRLVADARRVRIEVEGLDERALEELAAAVAERGGRVAALGPGEDALLELYRRLARVPSTGA